MSRAHEHCSELERIKTEMEEKAALAETAALEVECVKADSIQAMQQIQQHIERIEAQAKADKERADRLEAENDKLLGGKRAEVQRLQAVNKKALGDLRQMSEERRQMQAQAQTSQVQLRELSEIKTALARAQGETEVERVKAEKANEIIKRMEEIAKDNQEDKARKDCRISALEHKIKIMTRQAPCDRPDCDMSCGKDHHCGTPSIRPARRRSRSRNYRSGSEDSIPTTANLASQAGVPAQRMQQLVSGQAQASRLPPRPHPNTGAMKPSSGVELCRNYHYYKVCIRGSECRFAHELIPANANSPSRPQIQQGGSRAFNQAISDVQRQQGQQPKPRSRSGGRQIPRAAYHPDHPDFEYMQARDEMNQNQNQNQVIQANGLRQLANARFMTGNANEQIQGAQASAQNNVPQQDRPTGARPKVSMPTGSQGAAGTTPPVAQASASSDREARRTVANSLSQQASNQAQMRALRDTTWRNTMNNVVNMVSRAYQPTTAEVKTPSRSSSVGTSGFSSPANPE